MTVLLGTNGSRAAAEQLAEFLTARSNYNQKSPLQERIEVEILTLANEIAAETVKELPVLREIIQGRASSILAAALRDDAWLNKAVVDAVARAVTGLALAATVETGD